MSRVGAWLLGRWRPVDRPLADGTFAALLLATLIGVGWLAARHDRYWDWTAARDNTLTPETLAILERVQAPLRATVFIDAQDPLGKSIERLLARYRQALPEIDVRFVDPQRFPEQARSAKVSLAGQILLEYRGRRETLSDIGERGLSAAIARLTAARPPWIAALEGHGERRMEGESPADLGRFGQELKGQGYLLRGLDLATVADVPVNTHLVLVTNPSIPLFPGEVQRLLQYLDRGGNLLWLLDPGPLSGLEVLADQLGIEILPGTVVDAKAADFGVDTPMVAVVEDPGDWLTPAAQGDSPSARRSAQEENAALAAKDQEPDSAPGQSPPATSPVRGPPVLMPGAAAFGTAVAPGWTLAGLLATGPDSWNETGRIQGKISRDEVVGEQPGPLPVVLALTRPVGQDERIQRVLVVGDGDFLSNAQIGAFGNRSLGTRLLRWVNGEEGLLSLPPPRQPAEALVLPPGRRLLVGLGALAVLPGSFLIAGLAMRWARSRG
jgi:hypothetical protein